MERRWISLAVFAVVAILRVFGHTGGRSALETASWNPYSSPSGKFSMDLPGTMTEVAPEPGEEATSAHELKLEVGQPMEEAYLVIYRDLPTPPVTAEEKQAVLQSDYNRRLSVVQDRLTYNKNITIDGNPGIEFQYHGKKSDDLLVTNRLILAGGREYSLTTIMDKDRFDKGDNSKALDSFHVTT